MSSTPDNSGQSSAPRRQRHPVMIAMIFILSVAVVLAAVVGYLAGKSHQVPKPTPTATQSQPAHPASTQPQPVAPTTKAPSAPASIPAPSTSTPAPSTTPSTSGLAPYSSSNGNCAYKVVDSSSQDLWIEVASNLRICNTLASKYVYAVSDAFVVVAPAAQVPAGNQTVLDTESPSDSNQYDSVKVVTNGADTDPTLAQKVGETIASDNLVAMASTPAGTSLSDTSPDGSGSFFLVGTNMAPGTWKTDGAANGNTCTWQTFDSAEAYNNYLITGSNSAGVPGGNNSNPAGGQPESMVMTVTASNPTDGQPNLAFLAGGCKWHLVSAS